jgi:hypothetical protein
MEASTHKTKKPYLTALERTKIAEYALRHYFSENQKGKPWYRPGVTTDTVFAELRKPNSPISIGSLIELWREKESLRSSIFRRVDREQTVEDYLNREEGVTFTNERWEYSSEMIRRELDGIARAMIARISSSGLEKIRFLLNGTSIEDLSAKEQISLNEKIDNARAIAAKWFAKELWAHAGKVSRFLKLMKRKKMLTKNELALMTEEEFQFLCKLAYLKPSQIESILLDDIEKEDNAIKAFQNAVSHFAFFEMRMLKSSEEEETE